MDIERGLFNRTELLVGRETMDSIETKSVIIFGVGGVGSWCAESLVRSGIRKLTIVDADSVCVTNINRQLMATTKTVGQVKVEVLKKRLLEINPKAEIEALQMIYDENTADSFHIGDYDYIVDAIDSLKDKVLLIQRACETKAMFVSSMGAALKMNPTKVEVADFWKVHGCPLGAALRRKFKQMKTKPAKKFKCVFSEELLKNKGENLSCEEDNGMFHKAQINGTMAHITAIFGFTLAGLIMEDIYKQ